MSKVADMIRKAERHRFCSAVVVAAGDSVRMGQDKIFADLCGVPLLVHSLRQLDSCPDIDEIVIVVKSDRIVDVSHLCRDFGIEKVGSIVCGGETRAHSALAGLSVVSDKAELAAIHDGDRPLVTQEVIHAAVSAAGQYKAAAPAVEVKDTLKIVEEDVVTATPRRSRVRAVQTPQVFDVNIIKGALTNVITNELSVTDDATAAEILGVRVHLTAGSDENIKITTPIDIALAEVIIRQREGV